MWVRAEYSKVLMVELEITFTYFAAEASAIHFTHLSDMMFSMSFI